MAGDPVQVAQAERRLSQPRHPHFTRPEPHRPEPHREELPWEPRAVTDETFIADVLQSDKTVLVDFWAEWCGPCRQVSPILEEIASEHADKIEIVKLNVDENPRTAADYGITSIPTMNVYPAARSSRRSSGPSPRRCCCATWTPSSDLRVGCPGWSLPSRQTPPAGA